jgi:hypothetical protein
MPGMQKGREPSMPLPQILMGSNNQLGASVVCGGKNPFLRERMRGKAEIADSPGPVATAVAVWRVPFGTMHRRILYENPINMRKQR